ncbi:uncharacterized protein LOC124154351 [Ischnura elegans]|uniref:uncharacterized protein LOC124154351 n=1 Tax=Ischnura elegans TaxID=197161 RepID=UPI001ED87CDA|nr:uncharacterized protein LOC124154351 [Ischnura elegans]XP_046383982.1 uncharacterized protein LOC124154351 [Ischnura elegans]
MKAILCSTLAICVLVGISLVLAEDQRLKGPPKAFLVSTDPMIEKPICPNDMLSMMLLQCYDAGLFFLASIERVLTRANLAQPFPDENGDNCPHTNDTMDDFVRSIGHALDSSMASMERFVNLDSKKPGTEDSNETLDSFLKNINHAKDLISEALKRAAKEPEPTGAENHKTEKCSDNPMDTVARYILNAIDTIRKVVRQVQEDGPTEQADGKSEKGYSESCPVDYLEQVVRLVMRLKFLIARAYERATDVGDVTDRTTESNCNANSLDEVVDLFMKISKRVDQVITRMKSKAGTNDEAVRTQSNICSYNVSKDVVRTAKLFREHVKVSIFRSKYRQYFSKNFLGDGTLNCSKDSLHEVIELTVDLVNVFDKALYRVEKSVYLMITFPFKTLIVLTRNMLNGVCRVLHIFKTIEAVQVSELENKLQKQDHLRHLITSDEDRCSNDSLTDFLSFVTKARDVILDLRNNGSKHSLLRSVRSLPLDTVMGYVIYGLKLLAKCMEELNNQLKPDRQMANFLKLLSIPPRWRWLMEVYENDDFFYVKDPMSYICHPRFSEKSDIERPRRDTMVVH